MAIPPGSGRQESTRWKRFPDASCPKKFPELMTEIATAEASIYRDNVVQNAQNQGTHDATFYQEMSWIMVKCISRSRFGTEPT
jgi:hypothetical protein